MDLRTRITIQVILEETWESTKKFFNDKVFVALIYSSVYLIGFALAVFIPYLLGKLFSLFFTIINTSEFSSFELYAYNWIQGIALGCILLISSGLIIGTIKSILTSFKNKAESYEVRRRLDEIIQKKEAKKTTTGMLSKSGVTKK